EYTIMPDPIEAFAFVALGVTTNSEITIKNCPLDFLELELEKIKIMGQNFTLSKERKSQNGNFRIVDVKLKKSNLRALPDKISCQPFPGLNIDNLPFFIPILTQAKGRTLVHDWVYENRAIYGLELQKVGAEIYLIDPHRLFVEGKTKMTGAELMCPPAIRPAVAVLIAMIAAKGKSLLRNCYPIERGYENIVSRLHAIGVDIEQVN
ncbi:MAG: UDP-N-acetylglucosamine 1-carboxyvinyltransferase, partial [Candidatus Levybacteria bacterium CG10_big_fil_rev_8_21_14_0_10_36_7]